MGSTRALEKSVSKNLSKAGDTRLGKLFERNFRTVHKQVSAFGDFLEGSERVNKAAKKVGALNPIGGPTETKRQAADAKALSRKQATLVAQAESKQSNLKKLGQQQKTQLLKSKQKLAQATALEADTVISNLFALSDAPSLVPEKTKPLGSSGKLG